MEQADGPAFHVVLVEPEIAPNTGTVGRLCVAAPARLHLVHPIGFSLGDRQLKRAGLDYWHALDLATWDSFADLQTAAGAGARFFFLTTKSARCYWSASFRRGDYLVFGRETRGLPESLLRENSASCLKIPMDPAARSLNLASAVGIVLFEALRQSTPVAGSAEGSSAC